MKVYFVTQKWFKNESVLEACNVSIGGSVVDVAETIHLIPRVPLTKSDYEDQNTGRICVSMSLLGALSSIGKNLYVGNKTFVYTVDVDPESLYQPNLEEYFDFPMTGELWIQKAIDLRLEMVIKITDIQLHTLVGKNDMEYCLCKFEELWHS